MCAISRGRTRGTTAALGGDMARISSRLFRRDRITAPITTLTLAAFLATMIPLRLARAGIEEAQPVDTPNFAESTNGVHGGVDAAASTTKATKSRKAPVSSKGSFTRSIAIDVPPGRLGMTPSLALSYDSASVAESAVGVGWSFGASMIARSTRMGFPSVVGPDLARSYDESAATFTSPSGELVVAVDGPPAAGPMYAPARESSAVRYERLGDAFVEHDPSGNKRYFGRDPFNGATARITSELGSHAWLLLREEDRFGNCVTYAYHNIGEQNRADKRVAQTMPILARVEWGGNRITEQAPSFYVETAIDGGVLGPVNLLEGNTALSHRIRLINVGIDHVPSWSYWLDYTTSAETGKSLLAAVRNVRPEGTETTTFAYSAGAPASGPRFVDMGPLASGDPMYTNNSRHAESLDPFIPTRPTAEQAIQAPGHRGGTKFIDVDGNGTTDAIYHAAGIGTTATHVLWEESSLQAPTLSGLGGWVLPRLGPSTEPSTQPDTGLPYFPFPGDGMWDRSDFASSTVEDLLDLDGDGDADALSLATNTEVLPGRDVSFGFFPPPPHFEPLPWGQMRIRITTNTARAGGISHPLDQIVGNWPFDVTLSSRVYATSQPGVGAQLRYKVEPQSDVQMPIADLNADGRPDVVLLKHRQLWNNTKAKPGVAFSVPQKALLRFYGGMQRREQGEASERPLEDEVRRLVRDEGAVVLVDESLLATGSAPRLHVRLPTTAARLGIPGLPPQTPMYMMSAPGGIPMPGIPGGPPPGWGPDGTPQIPGKPHEKPWWMPVVDPEGDVYNPLRDSGLLGIGGAGEVFLPGEYRYVPRAYLMRGAETRALVPEPSENASNFETSMQRLLNKGSPSECFGMDCAYPPHVNFNSFLADVNGDGLPDLVSAEPTRRWTDGGGNSTLVCIDGHRVHLNRGYAFESAENETVAQTWADTSDSSSALMIAANRDRFCGITRPRIVDGSETPTPFEPFMSRPSYPMSSMAQTDINGDGRVDIVFAYRRYFGYPSVDQLVYLNTGRGFAWTKNIALPPHVAIADNAPFPNQIDPSLQGWPIAALPDMARFVDLDNDGLVDIISAGLCTRSATPFVPPSCTEAKWYRNAGTLPDRLERIDSTTGAWTTVAYASSKSPIVQVADGGFHPPATMRFVENVRSAAGPVPAPAGRDPFPVQEIRLSYEGFVRDGISNEVLGFETVHSEFVNAFDGVEREHVRVTSTYDVRAEVLDSNGVVLPVRHPLKGAPISTVTESGGWRSVELHEYLAEPLGSAVRVRPRRDRHGDVSPSATAAWTAEETTQFDAFGNPSARVTGNYDGSTIAPPEQRRTTLTTYENRTGAEWQLGLITQQDTVGYSEDVDGNIDPARVLSRHVTSYDARGSVEATARVNIRAAGCDGPSDDVKKFGYSPRGLLKASREMAGPGGAFTRDVHFTYDARDLYVATAETRVGRMAGTAFVPGATPLTVSFKTDVRHGKTTEAKDPNGAAKTSTYDSRGRVVTRTGPDGTLLEHNFYSDAFPVSETSTITTDVGKSYQRRTELDADGHALAVVEGAGTAQVPWSRKSKTRVDAFGRVVESFLPVFVWSLAAGAVPAGGPKSVAVHDGFDRVTQTTRADGVVTSTAYEPRETIETNARGVVTRRAYDAFGELAAVSRNPGGAADETSAHAFVRDGSGAIVRLVDGDGNVRRFERDGGGRLRFATLPGRPGGATTRFAMCHDVGDKLVHLESPAGRVVDLTHDELGRTLVSHATDANGLSVRTTQSYDAGVGGLGRLTRKSDESGDYKVEYDVYGRPSAMVFAPSARATAGAASVGSYAAQYVYTPSGSLTSVTFGGFPAKTTPAIVYTHDVKGRPTVIDAKVGAAATTLAADIVFDAADRVTRARYGNGTAGAWAFNAKSDHLDKITYTNATSGVLAAVAHVFDANGNVLEESREKLGSAGIFSQKIHAYDALDRLRTTNVSAPSGNQAESYTFSPSGNILVAGGELYTYGSPVSAQAASVVVGAAKQRALTYDADGYLASDSETRDDGSSSTRALAFDPTGCMRSITRTDVSAVGTTHASSDYTCGLDGRVVARATTKLDGSQSRRIDFAGMAEIRPDEGVFVLRVPLHGSVSVEDARSLTTGARVSAMSGYLISDARGTELATTGFDTAAPNPTREAEYDAWGKKLAGYSSLPSPRHGFAGAEADEAAGTYSFGARTYDPSLRRWVSPDPLLAAAPHLDEHVGDDLNLYAYAGNNPVRRIDLSGFEGNDWASKLGHSVAGFAYGFVQGVTPGGVLLPSPARDSPHAAIFQHWQGAGQIMGGGLAVGAGTGGAVAGSVAEGATAGAASPVAVPVIAVSAAEAVNGVVAISMGQKNIQEAQAKGDAPAAGAAPRDANTPAAGGAKDGSVARGKAPSQIDRAEFAKERASFWKAEAKANPGKYTAADLEKMARGRAPTGADGHSVELHHVDGTPQGGVKPMTRTEHRLGDNYKKNHP